MARRMRVPFGVSKTNLREVKIVRHRTNYQENTRRADGGMTFRIKEGYRVAYRFSEAMYTHTATRDNAVPARISTSSAVQAF